MGYNTAEKRRAYEARYRAKNRTKLNAKSSAWSRANPEKVRARNAAWQAANPEKVRQYRAGHYVRHAPAIKARNRAWYQANPQKVTEAYRKRRYGVTTERMEIQFAAQGWVCAICRTAAPVKGKWMIDHCHASGKFRGVLCNRCNSVLGMSQDRIPVLQEAINYLQKHAQL